MVRVICSLPYMENEIIRKWEMKGVKECTSESTRLCMV